MFELVKSCIQVKPFSSKLGGIIWEILLYDSSVYGVLWSILSVSTQLLHVRIFFLLVLLIISFVTFTWYLLRKFQDSYRSNYHGLKDIEDIQLVLCNGLDIIYHILSNLPEVKKGRHLVMSFSMYILQHIDILLIQYSFLHCCKLCLQLHICYMWLLLWIWTKLPSCAAYYYT